MREYSDEIIYGGINYLKKEIEFHSTNANGVKRIDKLEKFKKNEEYESSMADYFEGKYQIIDSLIIDFID